MLTNTATKPFVFTLMPFHKDFDDIWKLGIKATCEEAGTYCERVDEQIFEERMLDRIYNQINKADIIVADMTSKNPNVFYEVGYAHALNKRVILIIKDADDIPFDLRHHPFTVYGGSITELKRALAIKINYFVSNPESQVAPDINELEFYIDGTKITEGCEIKLPFRYQGDHNFIGYGYTIVFDLFNNSTKHYKDIKLGFSCESKYSLNSLRMFEAIHSRHIIESNGRNLFLYPDFNVDLTPEFWDRIRFMPTQRSKPHVGDRTNIIIRTFNALGVHALSFYVIADNQQQDGL